jgi:hypothetical protein
MTIRDVKAQATELGDRAARLGMGDGLKTRAKALGDKLTTIEMKLIDPDIKGLEDDLNYPPRLDHDLTFLAGVVGSADRAPTASSQKMYDELAQRLSAIRAELKGVLDSDLADFNRAVQAAGVPPVAASPKIER